MQNVKKKSTQKRGKKQSAAQQPRKAPQGALVSQSQRSRPTRSSIQSFNRSTDAKIIVRHREYIQDVGEGNDATFDVRSLAINPGLDAMFLWLSKMANNYEFYEFRKLMFEYTPSCSTLDSGNIILAVDFDAGDAAPVTKQELMSYFGAVQGPVWSKLAYVCDSANLHKFGRQKFTRPGALVANRDIKTYDVGNLIIATTGLSTLKGSLFVDYEVELSTPQTNALVPSDYSAYIRAAATSKAAPFSTGEAVNSVNTILSKVTSNQLKFHEIGEYLIDMTCWGTGLSVPADPKSLFTENLGSYIATNTYGGVLNGASSVLGGTQIRFNVTSKNTTFTFTPPAGWTTLTDLVLKVIPYDYSFAY